MADDLTIKIRAQLDLDPKEAASQIDAQTGNIQNNIKNNINIPVQVNTKQAQQQVQNAINQLNHIRGANKVTFPAEIDTTGMDHALQSATAQVDNYISKITEAGGIIKKMTLNPVTIALDDGETSQAYQALITYQTAIGETIQEMITLNSESQLVDVSMGKMAVNFEQQRNTMNNMADSIAQYTNKLEALKRQAAGVLTGTEESNSLLALVNSIDFSAVTTPEELDAMIAKFKEAVTQVQALNAAITSKKLAGTSIEQMNEELAKIPEKLQSIRLRFSELTFPDDITAKLKMVEDGFEAINLVDDPSMKIRLYNQMRDTLATIPNVLKNIETEQKKSQSITIAQQKAVNSLTKLQARYQAVGTRYSAFKIDSSMNAEYERLGQTIAEIQARLQDAQANGTWSPQLAQDIQNANAQLNTFNNRVVTAGKNTTTLGDQFRSALNSISSWVSATAIIMKAISALKDAVTQVKTLDTSMVNLKKVTDESTDSYEKFLSDTGNTAKRIGSSMSDLVDATATFAKLGFSFKDSQTLGEVATIFANVGDFDSIDTATNTLVTAMKAFGYTADDAMSIADKINEVSNNYAVTADDLAEGLANSASALTLAGNDIDQTLAMITAISEVTQDASEAGNAIKVLSMRLRGAKTDLESAGEDTDGMAESTSKLRESIMALTGGVDIMADAAGTKFKSTYQIMKDIAEVWNDMTDINQAALLETIAGKQRGNTISALLTNMTQAENVLKTSAEEATDSAIKEHERWLKSIEAAQQSLKAAWQDLSNSIIDSGFIKTVYDGATGILTVLTKIVDAFGSIPTLIGSVTGLLSAKNKWFGTATNSAGQTVGRIGNYLVGNQTNGIFGKTGGGSLVDQIFNGAVDTSVIEAYTTALQNGSSAAEAMKSAVVGMNGEVINLNNATRTALASQQGATAAMKAYGIATTQATLKTAALKAAMMALNVLKNIGISALVTAVTTGLSKAISGITELVDRAVNPVKYLKEELTELQSQIDKTESDLKSLNKELDETGERIAELEGKDSLTIVEQGELEKLRKINDELKKRKENLEWLMGQQNESSAKKQREVYQAEYQTVGSNATSEYDTKENALKLYAKLLSDEDFANGGGQFSVEDFRRVSRGFEDFPQEFMNYIHACYEEALAKTPDLPFADYAEAELRSGLEELYTFLEDYPLQDEFSTAIQGYIDSINAVLDPAAFKSEQFDKITAAYADDVAEITQQVADGTLTAESFTAQYAELAAQLESAGISAEEAVDQFKALAAAEEKATEVARKSVYDDIYERFTKTGTAQSAGTDVLADQGYSTTITTEQYEKLVEAGSQYADCVENINGYLQLNVDKYNELIQAEYEQERLEAAAAKGEAVGKYRENAAAIKEQEYALELLRLRYGDTSDEYNKFADTIKDNITALKDENDSILEEVRSYERLESQLYYATSAYKKWIDAQDAPNAGDAYNNMIEAMGQIQSGQESGKIGTAQYKAAVELLVPNGQEVNSYMETLGRYLTEDSSGLQNMIDDMFAKSFLTKDGSGMYSFMKGTTVQDIAEGLGLTDELTRYMLQALEDYGWNVDIFDEAFSEGDTLAYEAAVANLAKAEAELQAYQEKYAEAEANLQAVVADEASTYEEIADAKEKVAEADEACAAAAEEVTKATEQMEEASEVAGVTEETPLEKLQKELETIKGAYQELSNLKVGEGFDAQVKLITDVLNLLNLMPDGGYNIEISTPEELETETQKLQTLQAALALIDELATSGVITYSMAATLKDELTEGLNTLEAKIDEYNAKTLEEQSATINVTTTADAAEKEIQDVADKEYTTTLTVKPEVEGLDGSDGTATEETENPIEKLQEKLEAIRDVYQTLSEIKPGEGFEAQTKLITDVLSLLNLMPEGGYSVAISTPEEFEAETQKLQTLQAVLALIDALATNGVITYEMAATLKDDTSAGIDALKTKIDEYNAKTLDEQTATINVTTTADDAEKEIQAIADKKYTATITIKTEGGESKGSVFGSLSEDTALYGDSYETDFDIQRRELQKDIDKRLLTIAPPIDIEKAADEVEEAFEEINQGEEIQVTPSVDTRQMEEDTELSYDDLFGKAQTVEVTADTSDAVVEANSLVKKIGKMKATVGIGGKLSGFVSGIKNFLTLANGTHNAKEEDAIVGEAGVETWIHDGQYSLVGQKGAEFVHLERGDQILTNEETKKLFGNKKKFSGNAYASGRNVTMVAWNGGVLKKNALAGVVTTVDASGKDLGGAVKEEAKSSSGSGNSKRYTTDDLVDWIPTFLENLKKKTDEYIDYADKAVGYMLKNKYLNSAITNIGAEIDANLAAYDRYLQQADEIATKQGLSADIVQKIQDGTIDIERYDDDTRDIISDYQEWYDLAIECKEAVGDLRDQQYELSKQKLDNIVTHYENQLGLLETALDKAQKEIDLKTASGVELVRDDYTESLENTKQQIELLKQEREALNDEFEMLVSAGTIQVGSDDWYAYTKQIQAFDSSILDAQKSVEGFKDSVNGIATTNLATAMNALKNVHEIMQGLIDLRSAQGKDMTAGDYKNLIASTSKQIANLESQNEALRQQQEGLDVLSEKYQELEEEIRSNEQSILSSKAEQEKWNDSLIDLEIDKLKEQNEQYKNQVELMDALEEYEKAKQRRALIYREGKGFNYESLESDLRDAKETLDDIIYDRQIEALENAKKDSNLYDDYGNELTPITDTLGGVDLSAYYDTIKAGAEDSALLAEALSSLDVSKLIKNADAQTMNVSIESGAITLSGVNDVNSLAEAITNQLPNALMQQLYKG